MFERRQTLSSILDKHEPDASDQLDTLVDNIANHIKKQIIQQVTYLKERVEHQLLQTQLALIKRVNLSKQSAIKQCVESYLRQHAQEPESQTALERRIATEWLKQMKMSDIYSKLTLLTQQYQDKLHQATQLAEQSPQAKRGGHALSQVSAGPRLGGSSLSGNLSSTQSQPSEPRPQTKSSGKKSDGSPQHAISPTRFDILGFRSQLALQLDSTDWVLDLLPMGRNSIVSACSDATISLWDLESRSCRQTAKEHADAVTTLEQISEVSFASGSNDCTVIVWAAAELKPLRKLIGHKDKVKKLLKISAGCLASAGMDADILLWDVESSSCLHRLVGHTDYIWSGLAILSSRQFLSAGNDRQIRVWNIQSRQCDLVLQSQEGVLCLLVLDNDQFLAAQFRVALWNLSIGQCVKSKTGHEKPIQSMAKLSKNYFITCGQDGMMKIWELPSLDIVRKLQCNKSDSPLLVGLRLDEKRIVTGGEDQKIKVWN